ncbi:2,4-dichlorophenol 6-monooxygenase [Paraconexibacter sp. AEG42_29]|uniref:2,4-dichlorophenol 6-monooxygenase n=1 Tax=Paraconexibacter sp. AEG42_29 TaxID=2997339 RepID=A0AAU7AZM7_9ACTN
MREVEVPVLIMGGGGCGMSASSFLSEMGVEHLLVERHSETSHLPKAHYLNQRTMEIFRGFGMADPIYEVGAPLENFGHIRWVTSLGGDGPYDRRDFHEFDAFGGGVLKAPYEKDGPALPSNLPQIRLEPLLRKMAEERSGGRGEVVKFGHEIVEWEDTDAGIVATVLDRAADERFIVRARYMIAADGGKTVVPKLGTPMLGPTGMLEMVSTHFKADLSEYVDDKSMITWSINPEGEGSWSSGALVKMGPTWDRHSEEWVIHFAFRPDDPARFDEAAIVPRMRELLKIPDLDLEVLKVSHWILDRIHAEKFRIGNVFLAGDSAHRQPPTTGLGLNGAIHDAHNLCWKLAEVVSGRADDSLLDTYEAERLPVGADNADWALSAFTNFAVIDVAMGLMPGAPKEQNMAAFAAFFADTRLGASIRGRFAEVINTQRVEFHAHEIEIGYNYDSAAVVPDGTDMPVRDPFGSVYKPTTRPGHRLPHAWIERDGRRLSTHDLITPGTFALIAGADGAEWLKAASAVADELGVKIDAVTIGGTVSDVDGQWAEVGGLEPGGAVLVRPDQHTAWRTQEVPTDPAAALRTAFDAVLGKAAVPSA